MCSKAGGTGNWGNTGADDVVCDRGDCCECREGGG